MAVRTLAAAAAALSVLGLSVQASATALITYHGGPVISNVKVIAVFWTSAVSMDTQTRIPGLYTTITNSPFMDWLYEYDTPGGTSGTGQHIGRGSYGGAYTIDPSNKGTTLTETSIGTELVNQIQLGHLPKPELDAKGFPNTLYMFEFPPGYDITLGFDHACTGFCAFHYSVHAFGVDIPYGVHPDFAAPGSACGKGCGPSTDWFENATDTHTHELAEAITDPSVVTSAWYNDQAGEIGDVCATNTAAEVATIDGYVVQVEWSEAAHECLGSKPQCSATLTAPNCAACSPSECSGAAPICDLVPGDNAFGQCVACAVDADCSGTTPICGSDKICKACTSDGMCQNTAGHICELSGTNAGACSECTASETSACESGKCDPDGKCVPTGDSVTPGKGASGGCSVSAGTPAADLLGTIALVLLATIALRRRRA
jgi:MYXO-CTERM domain-containing protein